ncbi:MAG: TIR domain-containing protein [Vampirovibrionales bacterium]|jgi:predicted nucleotide-binding protein
MKLEKDIQKTKELIEQGQKFTFDDKKTRSFNIWRVQVAEIVLRHTQMEADRRVVETSGEIPDSEFYRFLRNVSFRNPPYNSNHFTEGVTKWTTRLQSILEHLEDRQEESSQNEELSLSDKNQVFIVHGHDTAMLHEVECFFFKTSELKHLKPIILQEQEELGRTIIEKLEQVAEEACFAIILYSPDDEGKSKKDTDATLKGRARQNVVWEHGYFVAKLGRERVLPIHKNNHELETPSDLNGIVYQQIQLDWKASILKELKALELI